MLLSAFCSRNCTILSPAARSNSREQTELDQACKFSKIASSSSSLTIRCVSAARTNTTYGEAALDFAAALGVAAVVYVEHRHAIKTSVFLGLYLAVGLFTEITKSRSNFRDGLSKSAYIAVFTAVFKLLLIGLEEVPKKKLPTNPGTRHVSDREVTSGFFTWKTSIFAILVSRLCVTGLTFAQPFLLEEIIDCVDPHSNASTQERMRLVGATFFIFSGAAVCRALTTYLKNRLITRLRGGLFSHLLNKSSKVEIQEERNQRTIALMDADFDNIVFGLPDLIEMPFTVIDVVIGIVFLFRLIGLSCLAMLIPLILSNVLGVLFSRISAPALKFWNDNIEVRVEKTSQVLSKLPAIKALGLRPKAARFIRTLRANEAAASKKFILIRAISIGIAVVLDLSAPVVVVAAALFSSALGETISAKQMYPTLGIIALIAGPLAALLKAYHLTVTMLAYFRRIEAVLLLDNHQDPRISTSADIKVACSQCSQRNQHGEASQALREKLGKDTGHILRFENVSITPHGSDTPVLKSIDLIIDAGSMNGVFGHTSSVKSTFLESILGEAKITEGRLYIDDMTVAVCAQQVWLPNTTFRDCIIGNCEYDPVWFNSVIVRCRLQQDLATLPNGENHRVGINGAALSDSQRQRVGIARTVYCRARTVIFDDSFSSLDKTTAVDILMGLCGHDGLLRTSGCTVIMVTHLPESLEVVDNLILIDSNGTVSCEPRLGSNGRPSMTVFFLKRCLLPQEDDDVRQDVSVEPLKNSGAHPQVSDRGQKQRQCNPKDPQQSDLRLYLLWVDAIGRISTGIWVSLILLMGINEVFTHIYVRIWIATAPGNPLFIIGYGLVALSSGMLCASCLLMNYVLLSPHNSNSLHDQLTATVTGSTVGFLNRVNSNLLLDLYSQDMDLVTKRIPQALYATLYCGTTSLVQIGIILSAATYMTAILPWIFGAMFMIQRHYLRSLRQLQLLQIETHAALIKEFREAIAGLVYIRAFKYQEHGFRRSLRLLDEAQKPFYLLLCSQAFLALTLHLLTSVIAAVLATVTLFARSSSQNATGLAFLVLINIGTSFTRFLTFWAMSESRIGSLSRLHNFIEQTPQETCHEDAVDLPPNWPPTGVIEISNVCAGYRVTKNGPDEYALHDVCLVIEPGKKTGITGRVGSGKSALILTLLGFLEYEGSIRIDGVDIRKAHPDQLRSRIITISQDVVEFEGTIRDNLLPYDELEDPTDGAVEAISQKEAERRDSIVLQTLDRLNIWEKLVKHGGLDAKLETVGFSQEEKQLMSIARAVVRRRLTGSRLLLVDETTASVDSWRDRKVREMIKEYFRGCTIIVVAQRTESIADSNQTVHMAEGRIELVQNHW
ncbi:hypothetical protein PWT90_02453 [Aphanocladium album]|nr:hypothetical protein PWT90_02453 [Aphanocladium album]